VNAVALAPYAGSPVLDRVPKPAPVRLVPETVRAPECCPMCGGPTKPLLMISHIQAMVAAYYQIPVREMFSARRHREVARPRQVAMYLAAEMTPKSLPEIGRRFGNRDHTTIIHGIRVIQQLMLTDKEMEADIIALRGRLTA
jgi:hypothetical protein